MPTANERKALWFLAFVALSGTGVRLWRSQAPPVPPAQAHALDRQIHRVDSARTARSETRGRSRKRPTPGPQAPPATAPPPAPPPAQPIDIDRADAAQLATLPGIGPALAGRIIAHRDSAGAFGSLEALCAVRGVGPALVGRLRPLVTFTGPRRPVSDVCGNASNKGRKTRSKRTFEPG